MEMPLHIYLGLTCIVKKRNLTEWCFDGVDFLPLRINCLHRALAGLAGSLQ